MLLTSAREIQCHDVFYFGDVTITADSGESFYVGNDTVTTESEIVIEMDDGVVTTGGGEESVILYGDGCL